LRTVCEQCGADLVMNWTVTLEEAAEEEQGEAEEDEDEELAE
jgi:hypothetical protein